MFEFVQATADDIISIEPQGQQNSPEALSMGHEMLRAGLDLEGKAVAAREDGKCIGAWGLIPLWEGNSRAWALFSERILAQYPGAMIRRVKRDLDLYESSHPELNRIEATVSADHVKGHQFIKWLGFDEEGLMRRYAADGSDAYLYARVRYVL